LKLAVTIAALVLSLLAAQTADAFCTLTLRYENGTLKWNNVLGVSEYWVLEVYGSPAVYRHYSVRGTSMAVNRRASADTTAIYVVTAVVPEGIRSADEELPPSEGTDACAASLAVTLPADPEFRALTRRAVLPIVGSTGGAFGGRFKTSLVLRPFSTNQRGRIVFHPAGQVASENDPSIPYAFTGLSPLVFDDVVAAMGQSGIGSLDIIPDEDASSLVPKIEARLFNETSVGTFGTVVAPAYPYDYLRPAAMEVTIPESDAARVNIGFRTLTAVTMRIFVEDAKGTLLSFHDVSYPAGLMQMTSAAQFVGKPLQKGYVVTVGFNGSVIPFYTLTDNTTNDPTLIVAPSRGAGRNVGAYVD
jgi:hypothetical protein